MTEKILTRKIGKKMHMIECVFVQIRWKDAKKNLRAWHFLVWSFRISSLRETRGRSLSIKCQNTSIERTPPPSIFSTSNFRVFQGAWAVGRQRCTVWTGNYLLNLMSLISDRSNDINFSFLLWKIYKEVTSFASKIAFIRNNQSS